jgi:energy-converting hydrogenase Eha subunit F
MKPLPITELLHPNPLARYEDGGIPAEDESAMEEVGP